MSDENGTFAQYRVYCAMHSFTDCVTGVTLGTAIWAVQWLFGDAFERWMVTPGWMGELAHFLCYRWVSHAWWNSPSGDHFPRRNSC